MSIRAMLPEDIPVIAAWMVTIPLWQRYRLTVETATAQFEAALAKGDILLTAEDDESGACGFAWCLPHGAFGRSAYLRLIGVRPDQTGTGMGARLLAQVEQIIPTNDLFLLVSHFNLDAQRFYLRQGYIQVGALRGYVLPDVTEFIYHKRVR